MGGTEISSSNSGDDGGRSGYDVTCMATKAMLAKAAFFVAFGIMMGTVASFTLYIPDPSDALFATHYFERLVEAVTLVGPSQVLNLGKDAKVTENQLSGMPRRFPVSPWTLGVIEFKLEGSAPFRFKTSVLGETHVALSVAIANFLVKHDDGKLSHFDLDPLQPPPFAFLFQAAALRNATDF
ncbi:hypothetical protein PG990_000953 [Apiospora arundinis]|uniref:Uncharacterized protein n=1 Tax=Apiospora arundinis TaxID=335852 RepID=A0ABR2I0S6_9PEZI